MINLDTIDYFKEIAKIPRNSGNEGKIADYLVSFAKNHNLEYYKDNYNNVLIKKRIGDKPNIILQSHTDMVCLSDNNYDFNQGIELVFLKDKIKANNTTLGADDGIGVALMLYALDNINANIDALFTSGEEDGMVGATHFDISLLTSKYLINLDGFDFGKIINDSALFYDITMHKSLKKKKTSKKYSYEVTLFGLPGGHSGFDIDKDPQNAIIILAKILLKEDIELVKFTGGTKNSVFPSQATVILNADNLSIVDNNITTKKIHKRTNVYSDTLSYLKFLSNFPSTVLSYNELKEVITSVNLGVIDDTYLEIGLRSNDDALANEALENINQYAEIYDFKMVECGFQPRFHTDHTSPLIQKLMATCPVPAEVKRQHTTLEVGFFQEKIPDLDMAVISPDIKHAHSTSEYVDIKSIKLTEKWLEEFFKSI